MSPGILRPREATIAQSTDELGMETTPLTVDTNAAPKLAGSCSGLTTKQRCWQAIKNLEHKLKYGSSKEV
jgi:hypothetical protein